MQTQEATLMRGDRRRGRPVIVVISRSCKCVKSQSRQLCAISSLFFCRQRARDMVLFTHTADMTSRPGTLVTKSICSFTFCLDMQKEPIQQCASVTSELTKIKLDDQQIREKCLCTKREISICVEIMERKCLCVISVLLTTKL